MILENEHEDPIIINRVQAHTVPSMNGIRLTQCVLVTTYGVGDLG